MRTLSLCVFTRRWVSQVVLIKCILHNLDKLQLVLLTCEDRVSFLQAAISYPHAYELGFCRYGLCNRQWYSDVKGILNSSLHNECQTHIDMMMCIIMCNWRTTAPA